MIWKKDKEYLITYENEKYYYFDQPIKNGISKTYTNKFAQQFYIFDAYIISGINVMVKPFGWNKEGGRHSAIKKMINYILVVVVLLLLLL